MSDNKPFMKTCVVKRGQTFMVNGLPFYLEEDAKFTAHEKNWWTPMLDYDRDQEQEGEKS